MKESRLSHYPLDEEAPLHHTKLLYLQGGAFSTTVSVSDVTNALGDIGDTANALKSTTLQDDAKAKAAQQTPILELKKEAWYKRNLAAASHSGEPVAQVSGPLLELGHWKLAFPPESPHSSHDIDLRPTGMGQRADFFVKDSVLYFWDMPDAGRLCQLFKVVGDKRREIARFVGKRSRLSTDKSGVLLLDEEQADEVVVVLTCVAVLNRSDSFRK